MTFIVRSLFLITILTSCAQASLIQNSGFDKCTDPLASACLDQFEVFATETNAGGDESFSIIDSSSNVGVFFNAGRLTPPNLFTGTSAQGGGIRQSFDFTGGDINIDVDYNVFFNTSPFASLSSRGSITASLLGPGNTTPVLSNVFSFITGTSIDDTSAQGRLNLSSITDLLAGVYTLQVSFTRAFLLGDDTSFGLTGVSATSTAVDGPNEVPEPGTLAILFIALAGVTATRKK